MPTRNYGVNRETLLVLAWCTTLDLRALLQQDQQARPYKYPQSCEQHWYPTYPEDILRAPINEALACFQDDPYGPALQSLVEHRLTLVDMQEVARAISLDGLADSSHALFFSDSLPWVQETDETQTFLQAVSKHASLQERLLQLSQIWSSNVCLGAQYLRTFFLGYTRMMLKHREAPFFVSELLSISLQQVDWHTIAAHILDIPVPSCQCSSVPSQENAEVVNVQLLQELLTLSGDEIRRASRRLPDHLRSNALFLSGLCRDTANICTSESQ
jgi:hypothetical protein